MPDLYTMPELLETIKLKIESGSSWGDVAKELYPNGNHKKVRLILWRIANDDYYPKRNDLRSMLRLPKLVEVEACPDCNEVHIDRCPKVETDDLPSFNKMAYVVIVGDLPDGAQIGGIALVCECGTTFIPNHPRRRRCFLCSPYRGGKK